VNSFGCPSSPVYRSLPRGGAGFNCSWKELFTAPVSRTDLDQCLFTIGIVFISVAVAAYFYHAAAADQHAVLSARLSTVHGNELCRVSPVLICHRPRHRRLLVYALEYTRFGAQVRLRRQPASWRAPGIDVDRAFRRHLRPRRRTGGLGGALAIEMVGLDHAFAFTYLVYVLIVVAVGGLARSAARSPPPRCSASATWREKYYFLAGGLSHLPRDGRAS